jgi:hypothetical protein
MIYKMGYTAEKAISEFRQNRKPSLGKASQRKSIKDFEKCKIITVNTPLDLIESRKIFNVEISSKSKKSKQVKVNLFDYISNQIQINPIVEDLRIRNTPTLVEKTFNKLESMIKNGIASSHHVLTSFFDLDNPLLVEDFGKWTQDKESMLDKAKMEVNEKSTIQFSQYADTRIVSQLLLDFLEAFSDPVISKSTIDYIWKIVNESATNKEAKQAIN